MKNKVISAMVAGFMMFVIKLVLFCFKIDFITTGDFAFVAIFAYMYERDILN